MAVPKKRTGHSAQGKRRSNWKATKPELATCPNCGAKVDVVTGAKCEYCGKEMSFGIKVSHSHRRSNRTWKPNIKRVKAIVNGSPKRVYVCTRCLRSGKVERA